MSEATMGKIDTHHARIDFGKMNGERITRLPIGYLKWAVGAGIDRPITLHGGLRVPFNEVAKAEIERRGERIEGIEVSGHAIDRLSQAHMKRYNETRKEGEGLYTWAQRKGLEAVARAKRIGMEPDATGCVKVPFDGMNWVIIVEQAYPTVKTIT